MAAKLERHAEQLSALGHPVRLADSSLRRPSRAGRSAAGDIQAHVDLPASTLSHHLKRLVDAGCCRPGREGTFHLLRGGLRRRFEASRTTSGKTAASAASRAAADLTCALFFSLARFRIFSKEKPMNILKPHVSLNVSNIDASVAFYEKAFGVQRDEAPPRLREVRSRRPSLNLTMQEAPRTGSTRATSASRSRAAKTSPPRGRASRRPVSPRRPRRTRRAATRSRTRSGWRTRTATPGRSSS